MDQDKMIEQITAKLTREEKDFLINEVIGYPIPIVVEGTTDINEDDYGALEHYENVKRFKIDETPESNTASFGDDYALWKSEYRQTTGYNPHAAGPDKYAIKALWEAELLKNHPNEVDAIAFYQKHFADETLPNPQINKKVQPDGSLIGSEIDENSESVSMGLDDFLVVDVVSTINNERKQFLANIRNEYDKAKAQYHAAIVEFKKNWNKEHEQLQTKRP